MDTARPALALEEKYQRWKETHLPLADTYTTFPLAMLLQTLDNERLLAAHKDAVAGLIAEKLLARTNPFDNFRYAAGLTAELLFRRGLHGQQEMDIQARPSLDDQ
jgi:hypothetical protein